MTTNETLQRSAVRTSAAPDRTSVRFEDGRDRTGLRDGAADGTARTSARPAAGAEPPQSTPTDDEIRVRAHEIYRARCDSGAAGDEVSDWIAAECELRARGSDPRPAASTNDGAGRNEPRGE